MTAPRASSILLRSMRAGWSHDRATDEARRLSEFPPFHTNLYREQGDLIESLLGWGPVGSAAQGQRQHRPHRTCAKQVADGRSIRVVLLDGLALPAVRDLHRGRRWAQRMGIFPTLAWHRHVSAGDGLRAVFVSSKLSVSTCADLCGLRSRSAAGLLGKRWPVAPCGMERSSFRHLRNQPPTERRTMAAPAFPADRMLWTKRGTQRRNTGHSDL
ncbi:hypothetical protein BKP43_50900 [Variovorax boronicumulans]|nr:hypothetical protein BKP43_50900 [Variovorax boronicumulans]